MYTDIIVTFYIANRNKETWARTLGFHVCCSINICDNQVERRGMLNSQSIESGFESPFLPFRSLGISVLSTTPQREVDSVPE